MILAVTTMPIATIALSRIAPPIANPTTTESRCEIGSRGFRQCAIDTSTAIIR
jgi:hypothetical protein